MSRTLVFDLETDGLLDSVTKIHCIVAKDFHTKEVFTFAPHQITEGIKFLSDASTLIAHNGFGYDYIVLEMLYPALWDFKGKREDSFVQASLIWSHIRETDFRRAKTGRLPSKLIGSQSLKAWGYRLGVLKGEFGETSDWQTYTPEMLSYCVQDVEVTYELWTKIEGANYSTIAMELETRVAILMVNQERNGFVFNEDGAIRLYSALVQMRDKLRNELQAVFGCWYRSKGLTTPKRTVNYKDKYRGSTIAGAQFTKVEYVEFNPSSRAHIAQRLRDLYGWQPTVFNDKSGDPKIDEEILSKLDNPHAKAAVDFFKVNKTLGQLAEGRQAWLGKVRNGKIHHHVNTNKAVTGRATHTNPNLAQVPSVSKDKDGNLLLGLKGGWGYECRTLFTVPEGWVLVGSDASGLELRCLGHYMAIFDNGDYIDVVLNGDIHTVNQLAAGLPTRAEAKRFIYAFLYGAGDVLLGSLVLPNGTEDEQKRAGKKLRNKFLKNVPALKRLIDAVKQKAKAKGHLIGLDKRRVFVRSEHSALNTLLQSAGALVCKHWIVTVDKLMQEAGFKHGWDGDYVFCAWVHDEIQVACKNETVGHALGKTCKEAMTVTEKYFSFKCPLDADYQVGVNWAETH